MFRAPLLLQQLNISVDQPQSRNNERDKLQCVSFLPSQLWQQGLLMFDVKHVLEKRF